MRNAVVCLQGILTYLHPILEGAEAEVVLWLWMPLVSLHVWELAEGSRFPARIRRFVVIGHKCCDVGQVPLRTREESRYLYGSAGDVGKGDMRLSQTLIFAISTLNFLVNILLHISFQNSRTGWLVEAGGFQYMGCVDPVIVPSSHNMFLQVGTELEFINGDLKLVSLAMRPWRNNHDFLRHYM